MGHVGTYMHMKTTPFPQKINPFPHPVPSKQTFTKCQFFGGLWPSLRTPLLLTKTPHINIH